MQLLNCKNPDISLALIPWFVPSDDMDRLEIGWELHEMLRERPDDVFCAIAIENDVGQAILIAYTRENDVWIWQARAKANFKYQKLLYDGLVAWSRMKGFRKLRCGVQERKVRKLYKKKWGFVPCKNNEMEKILCDSEQVSQVQRQEHQSKKNGLVRP